MLKGIVCPQRASVCWLDYQGRLLSAHASIYDACWSSLIFGDPQQHRNDWCPWCQTTWHRGSDQARHATAKALLTCSISSSMVNNASLLSLGCHPKSATKLSRASGRYPLSMYCSTWTSPDLFDNLDPSGFSNSGKWANSGGVHPSALYSKMCLGVDESHSSPLKTCVISIEWSSTTLAKWYVG